jgi:hypothetical protein
MIRDCVNKRNIRMQINRDELTRQYASLSDGELLPSSRTNLRIDDNELDRRRFTVQAKSDAAADIEIDRDDELEPDWLDTAATGRSLQVGSGQREPSTAMPRWSQSDHSQ